MTDLFREFNAICTEHNERLKADPGLAERLDSMPLEWVANYADSLRKSDSPLAAMAESHRAADPSPLLVEIDPHMSVVKFAERLARIGLLLVHRNGQPPLLTRAPR